MNNIVVYGWYHNDQIFYVGIGSRSRSRSKSERNTYCRNKRSKAERENCFEVRILHGNLTWQEACELEQYYIQQYGRLDLKTGCLTNMTDGGDGTPGRKYTEQQLLNKSQETTGKNNPFYGRRHTIKSKEQMSKLKKGNSCRSVRVVTPLGEFSSMKDAAKAHSVSRMTMTRLVKRDNSGYYRR